MHENQTILQVRDKLRGPTKVHFLQEVHFTDQAVNYIINNKSFAYIQKNDQTYIKKNQIYI